MSQMSCHVLLAAADPGYYIACVIVIMLYILFICRKRKKALQKREEKEEQERRSREVAVAAIDREFEQRRQQELMERKAEERIQENRKTKIRNTFSSNPIYTQIIPLEARKWAQELAEKKKTQISVQTSFYIKVGESQIKIANTDYFFCDYGLQNLPDYKNDGIYYYMALRDFVREKFISEFRSEMNRLGVNCTIKYNDTSDCGINANSVITCQIGTLSSW